MADKRGQVDGNTVDIEYHGQNDYDCLGVKDGNEVLAPLDLFLWMSCDPTYDRKTNEISLTGENCQIKCRVGSKAAVVNGVPVTLGVAPRFSLLPDNSQVTGLFVPMRQFATMCGLSTTFSDGGGTKPNELVVVGPTHHIDDFSAQSVAPATELCCGDLTATAAIDFRNPDIGPFAGKHAFEVQITMHNNGSTIIHIDGSKTIVETGDGSILSNRDTLGDSRLPTFQGNLLPGQSCTFYGGLWAFQPGRGLLLKRILYLDDQVRFQWRFKEGTLPATPK